MRLRPGHVIVATVAIIVLPIVATLALGGELRDLPWGAMVLVAILGAFVARRAARPALDAAETDGSDADGGGPGESAD